jgi:hypothetical protein
MRPQKASTSPSSAPAFRAENGDAAKRFWSLTQSPIFGAASQIRGQRAAAQLFVQAIGEPEGLMSRPRAADDFKTIRARLEELRREERRQQPASTAGAVVAFHRGPCACGRSLFPDECDGSCKML